MHTEPQVTTLPVQFNIELLETWTARRIKGTSDSMFLTQSRYDTFPPLGSSDHLLVQMFLWKSCFH